MIVYEQAHRMINHLYRDLDRAEEFSADDWARVVLIRNAIGGYEARGWL